MGRLSREQVAAWALASCQAQGVPVKVTDPVALGRVCSLLGGVSGRTGPARQRGEGAPDGPPTAATRD